MMALVYHGPGRKIRGKKTKPVIKEPAGAILKIPKSTICGTDLHVLKGERILTEKGFRIPEDQVQISFNKRAHGGSKHFLGPRLKQRNYFSTKN
jgi:hypothetical protein